MQFNKIIAGSLLTLGAVTSACQSDNIEIPKSELYTREFIKEFGVVDPNHDWNNAAQGSVTVVTSSPTHVEVLADIKGKRYIFADYRKVNGTETINFTIPKGISNIIVSLNGREVNTTLGATVNATSGSRAIWDQNQDPNNIVTVSRTEDFREISDVAVRSFGKTLLEGENNLGKVTQNFEFVANGPFTIYPVFWKTSAYNTLGIYYIREDESTGKKYMVHVPFYTHKIAPIDDTKGNLLYLPYECRTPGLEGHWCEAKGDYIIREPANYNENGKTNYADFDDSDWTYFKKKVIESKITISNAQDQFDISVFRAWCEKYGWGFWDKGLIDDIEYAMQEDNTVKITRIHIATIEEVIDKSDESKWVYPGSSDPTKQAPQNSYPDYDTYAKYVKDGLTEEEMIEKQFKFPALWRSRGINIDIAPGTHFGMYIRTQNWNDKQTGGGVPSKDNIETTIELELGADGKPMNPQYTRFYSNSFYNEKDMADPQGGSEPVQAVHAATYPYKAPSGIEYRVLGFEDWSGTQSDRDLNDMIFFIGSADPSRIPEVKDEDKIPEKYTYLLAAEDLGGTCDWDFNDLVVGVNVVAKNYVEAEEGVEGSTASHPYQEVTVTPLASGGTLPIYLMYTGKVSTSKDDYDSATSGDYLIGREFHSWLTNSQNAPLTPTNVGARADSKGKSITFHVPESKYTLAENGKYATSEGSNNMGGFWVLVINHEDTPYTPTITDENGLNLITDIPDGKGITEIKAPHLNDLGNIAPQMLCIGHEWLWPRESMKIHSAYPTSMGDGFEGWVRDHENVGGKWYGEGKYVESLVTKRDL